MKIGEIIHFYNESFFDGAVQLSWFQRRPEAATLVAESFVFHGPRYHGISKENDTETDRANNYKLKDTASFVSEFLSSLIDGLEGKEVNPYWLVIAGYGSGKSHLAVTLATLLSKPQSDTSHQILEQLEKADKKISDTVAKQLPKFRKPVLVLPLDGMAGFHLGSALSKAVFQQLKIHNIDAEEIRALSPRFQIAERFVERNFKTRQESFTKHLSNYTVEEICSSLRDHDEIIYNIIDTIYEEANGNSIPIEGQESSQELIETLCNAYCGEDKYFSQVVILFDELGRYLEYASEKPQLAGDANLQQIFQGVQDNNTKVRFLGFIQYELKTYLKRFGDYDLHQLQRYVTRFETSEKYYLSTNLETIFARMIGKKEEKLQSLWIESNAEEKIKKTWKVISNILPGFSHSPIWSDFEIFSRVIGQGCWPLHPLAVWFLAQQKDLVQSRSALTFIKDVVEELKTHVAIVDNNLRQVSVAELVLKNMLPELIAAERHTGGVTAETLQNLLEKLKGHIVETQQLILTGVAVIEKMRVGKLSTETANALLSEVTNLSPKLISQDIEVISNLGAMEWNEDLGQYELLSDGATRGQFQQWLRSQQAENNADKVRDLFIRYAKQSCDLKDIQTDFGEIHEISTTDWYFKSDYAHKNTIENQIKDSFRDWEMSSTPKEAKGNVIYMYLHSSDDFDETETVIKSIMSGELNRLKRSSAPIWVIILADYKGILAGNIVKKFILEEKISQSDNERFRRFIPEALETANSLIKESSIELLRENFSYIAGFSEAPKGRLKNIGNIIFQTIYPKAIPFPFDGFASQSGGGAGDAAVLMRGLITQQVHGQWVQSQVKRLQNRIDSLLVRSWKALLPSGKISKPSGKAIKEVFTDLEESHKKNPTKTLFDSYDELIKPPYGMNSSSAGIFLGLLLGIENPPRRIVFESQMIPAGEWLKHALGDQKGKNQFDIKTWFFRLLRGAKGMP